MHRLRPERTTRRRVPRKRSAAIALAVGIGYGLASETTRRFLAMRPERRDEDDLIASFPAHAALRRQLVSVAAALGRQRRALGEWELAGQPLDATEAVEAANELVAIRALELADVEEALEPLLTKERERATLIGPRVTTRLQRYADLAQIGTSLTEVER